MQCMHELGTPVMPYLRMAHTPFRGAGKLSGKSNRENCPGASGMANIMLCCFHCKRSSMFSSLHGSRTGHCWEAAQDDEDLMLRMQAR